MKYKLAKPFLFLFAFILIVGLACSVFTQTESESIPPTQIAEPTIAPVEEPPTSVPPPPTEPVIPEFYTEEFDATTSLWTYFLIDANRATPLYVKDDFGTMFVGIDDGHLVFNLESERQWAYVTYDAYQYENVRLDVVAENRGVNNNNVTLICRYTPDEGWYEFNIANNGLYWMYYAEMLENKKIVYHDLANGGSNKIKMGKEINQYSIICSDQTLSLYINGHETANFEDNKYILRNGFAGVGVASFVTLPVKVEFDSITISQP